MLPAVFPWFALCCMCASAQVPTLEELGAAWLSANESVGNPPTVTNFVGASAITADPLDALGVDSFDAFPFVGWLRTRLTAVDDSGESRVLAPNASRWLAHRTERAAAFPSGADFAAVSASVAHRFLFESASTLVTLTLRNDGASPVRLRSLTLLATAGVRTATELAWVVPRPADDGSWDCGVLPASNAARSPVLRFLDAISRARLVVATAPAPAAFGTLRQAPPAGSTGGSSCWGNASFGDVELDVGGEWSLTLAMLPDTNASAATASLVDLLAGAGAAAAASDAAWQARWAAAFTPGNSQFSGHAPTLAGGAPPAVASFYYMSVLTIITTQRNWPTSPLAADCPRLYAIGHGGLAGGGAPGNRPLGGAAFWLWDAGYASLTLSLLDPAAVRAYLRAVLGALDFTAANAFDLLSGQPIPPWPDGFGGGGAYFFNALQLFTMVENYVSSTNDTAFLDERPRGGGSARVVDSLLGFALHWRSFAADGSFLAEYSASDDNYLECVPAYRGAVAALQAGSVHMMRRVADLIERLYARDAVLAPRPPELRALAANVSAATRAALYLPGRGFWAARVAAAAPPLTPVPSVVDFSHVGRFLRGDLSAAQAAESAAFFLDELLFPAWTGWLRALAAPEGPYSQRADHGTTGAYTTWASLSIEALAMDDGGWARAAGLFARFAPALRLGPLGQAGQVQVIGGAANDSTLHPVFKAPEWPFVNVAGANFADVIIRSLFGFAPAWAPAGIDGLALSPPLSMGGVVGTLAHLRTPLGRLATVTSDGARTAWALEEGRGGA